MDYHVEINKLKRRIESLENPNVKKCLVKGCQNKSGDGTFIGDFCTPCYDMITTGKVHPKNITFIGELSRKSVDN